MRPMLVLSIATVVLAGSMSGCVASAEQYTDDVAAILRGEKTIEEVAWEIAEREFNPNASLIVKRVEVRDTMSGYRGETVEADPGYAFFHTRVRVINEGTLSLSVSTWQFSAVDEAGSETPAELPMAHQDFDATRLRKGAVRDGWVVFEMPVDANLTAVVWQGTLTEATGPYNGTIER